MKTNENLTSSLQSELTEDQIQQVKESLYFGYLLKTSLKQDENVCEKELEAVGFRGLGFTCFIFWLGVGGWVGGWLGGWVGGWLRAFFAKCLNPKPETLNPKPLEFRAEG